MINTFLISVLRCAIPGLDNGTFMLNHTVDEISPFIPRKSDGEFDSCTIYQNTTTNTTITRCTTWVYDNTYYQSSRAIEWDFVCDRRWMGAVAQSAYMFGVFVGAVFLGNAADKYGRKKIFCLSALLQLVLGVAVAFTTEFYTFLVVRFLYGIFGSAGSYIPGFVLTMELVGASKRSSCGVTFQALFAGGIMLVAGWGALIKDRQWLQVVYGLHSLILILHWWLMDESIRWLWSNGRTTEAVRILNKALKMNGSAIRLDEADYVSTAVTKNQVDDESSAGLIDLVRTPTLRKRTLNVCLCWFANSLVYYGLSLNTGKLNGNPFLILFLMGLVEIPSYIATIYLMDRLGRRSLTSTNMILGSICCIVAVFLASGSAESTAIVMAGKFLISSSFAIVYNYSAELFPTVIRNSAMGIFSMCARTSGALTPLITLLDSFNPKLPSVVFAVIALVSGFLALFLPETLGEPMPQSIEDGEYFKVDDTCFSTGCCGGRKKSRRGVTERKPEVGQQMEPLSTKR